MRIRRLQRFMDGVWYDDAYAFKNGKGPVTFRYNLTWDRVGDRLYRQIREQNIGLSEIESVIPEGEYMHWLTIEEIEEEKAEAHLEMLDELCCIPKPRFIGRTFIFDSRSSWNKAAFPQGSLRALERPAPQTFN